jgi:hypothetical protein
MAKTKDVSLVQLWRHGLMQLWRDAFVELRHDLPTIGWQRLFVWCAIILWTGGLTTAFIALTVLVSFPGLTSSRDWGVCNPDESFRTTAGKFNYWASSGFFQITFGFGKWSFTKAKVIDVVWDIVSTLDVLMVVGFRLTRASRVLGVADRQCSR